MTLSRKVRLSNKEEALKLLLERLDNRAIDQWIDVHPGDQFFAGIFATTWKQPPKVPGTGTAVMIMT